MAINLGCCIWQHLGHYDLSWHHQQEVIWCYVICICYGMEYCMWNDFLICVALNLDNLLKTQRKRSTNHIFKFTLTFFLSDKKLIQDLSGTINESHPPHLVYYFFLSLDLFPFLLIKTIFCKRLMVPIISMINFSLIINFSV